MTVQSVVMIIANSFQERNPATLSASGVRSEMNGLLTLERIMNDALVIFGKGLLVIAVSVACFNAGGLYAARIKEVSRGVPRHEVRRAISQTFVVASEQVPYVSGGSITP